MLQPTFWQEENYYSRVRAREARRKTAEGFGFAAIVLACAIPLIVWILHGPLC